MMNRMPEGVRKLKTPKACACIKGRKMKEKSSYKVDRGFCEKLVVLLNHSTIPVMDTFRADKKAKRRIVIDYDPQAPKVTFTYYEEDTG